MKTYYNWWLIKGILGLILTSAGVFLILEAIIFRNSGVRTIEWGAATIVALVVFNSGLGFFGSSILSRMRYERAKRREASNKS